MAEDPSFQDLVRRVRARDEQAAAELVRRYERVIRAAVRVRLTDPQLRRLLDSVDVCQSVLANFFVRAAAGQFELDKPEQLLRLLTTMAQNRLINELHKQRAARRDYRRQERGNPDEHEPADRAPSASAIVAGQELLQEFRSRLSESERYLVDQRALGRGWTDLAAETGESPDGLRMRYTRALDRVARELQLEE